MIANINLLMRSLVVAFCVFLSCSIGAAEQSDNYRLTSLCQSGQEDRSSDLCAQWKAADGAFESALWAKRTFWLNFAGLVIGALTLGAAGWAAWYARSAASAANAANTTSRQLFIESERAWIVSEIIFEKDTLVEDGRAPMFEISIQNKNIGKTPALNVSSNVRIVNYDDTHVPDLLVEELVGQELAANRDDGVILVPQERYRRPWILGFDDQVDFESAYVIGCITYNIIGSEQRRYTSFCYTMKTKNENGDIIWGLYADGGVILKDRIVLTPWRGGRAT